MTLTTTPCQRRLIIFLSCRMATRIANPTLQLFQSTSTVCPKFPANKWQSQDRNPSVFIPFFFFFPLQTLFSHPLGYSRAVYSFDRSYTHTAPAWLLITCFKQQSCSTFQFYIAWNTTNGKSYNERETSLIYAIAHLSPAVPSCRPLKGLCWRQKTEDILEPCGPALKHPGWSSELLTITKQQKRWVVVWISAKS